MALLSLGAIALAPRMAAAQAWEPRVVFVSSVGYNDNVTNAPEYPKDGASPPVGDGFVQLTPSASLTLSDPLRSARLYYTFDARLNVERTIANTYGHKVGLDASYAATPTLDLGGQLSGKLGRLGVTSATDVVTESLADSLPPGLFYYLDVTAGQSLTKTLSPRLRLKEDYAYNQRFTYESASDFAGDPKLNRILAGAASRRATNTATGRLEYDFELDSVAPVVSLSYQETTVKRVLGTYYGSWKHDFQHLHVLGLTSQLDVGLAQLFDPETPDRQIWQPIAAATISYDDGDNSQLSLGYTHTPKANLLTGRLSFNDAWTVRGTLPLDRDDQFAVSGSFIYERDLQIDAAGYSGDPQHIFLFDGQLNYSPEQDMLQLLRFSLRFTRRLQLPMPLARGNFVAFDGSATDTIMFSIAAAWPERQDFRKPFVLAPATPPTGSTDVLTDSAPAAAPAPEASP